MSSVISFPKREKRSERRVGEDSLQDIADQFAAGCYLDAFVVLRRRDGSVRQIEFSLSSDRENQKQHEHVA